MALSARTLEYALKVVGDTADAGAKVGDLDGRLDGMAATAATAAASIATAMAGAVASVAALQETLADTVDTVHTFAASSGLSADTVNGLRLVAQRTRKELSDLVPPELAKRIAEARLGTGEAAKGFDQMGIQARIAAGELRTSDEVLRASIDALMQMEDETERAAAATLALGEQGKQLLSAFGDSAELDRFVELGGKLGVDVGPAATAALDDWTAATFGLSLALEESAQIMSESLAGSAINALIDAFGTGLVGVTRFATTYLDEMADALGRVYDGLSAILTNDLSAEAPFTEALGGLYDLLGGGATTEAVEQSLEAMAGYVGGLEEATDALGDAGGAVADYTAAKGEAAKADAAARDAAKAHAEALKEQRKARDELVKSYQTAEVRNDLAQLDAGGLAKGVTAAADFDRADVGFRDASGGIRGRDPASEADAERSAATVGDAVAGAMASTVIPALGVLEGIVALPDQIGRVTETINAVPDAIASVPLQVSGLIEGLAGLPLALVEVLPEAIVDLLRVLFTELPVALAEAFLEMIKAVLPGDAESNRKVLASSAVGQAAGLAGIDVADKDTELTAFGLKVPFFDTGGYVGRTGLAVVHEGEFVQTKAAVQAAAGGGSVNIGQITVVSNDPADMVRQIREHIGRYGAGSLLGPSVFG